MPLQPLTEIRRQAAPSPTGSAASMASTMSNQSASGRYKDVQGTQTGQEQQLHPPYGKYPQQTRYTHAHTHSSQSGYSPTYSQQSYQSRQSHPRPNSPQLHSSPLAYTSYVSPPKTSSGTVSSHESMSASPLPSPSPSMSPASPAEGVGLAPFGSGSRGRGLNPGAASGAGVGTGAGNEAYGTSAGAGTLRTLAPPGTYRTRTPQGLSPGLAPGVPAIQLMPDLTPQSSRRSGQSAQSAQSGELSTDYEKMRPNPLVAELERLMEQCNSHEVKYRASEKSFQHRLFMEFPDLLQRLSKLDADAELVATSLHVVVNKYPPLLQSRLGKMVTDGQEDVETMRRNTTPWRDFLPQDEEDDEDEDDDEEEEHHLDHLEAEDTELVRGDASHMATMGSSIAAPSEVNGGLRRRQRPRSRSRIGPRGARMPGGGVRLGKIERVKGAGADLTDADALAMLERWAEEVELRLTDQIAQLKKQLQDEDHKRTIVFRLIGIFGGVVVVIVLYLWLWVFR